MQSSEIAYAKCTYLFLITGWWMFHPSWHMCIYKRMFESENKTLAKESVIHFLQIWQRKCLPSSQGFSEVRFTAYLYKILFINPLQQGLPTPKLQWWAMDCLEQGIQATGERAHAAPLARAVGKHVCVKLHLCE